MIYAKQVMAYWGDSYSLLQPYVFAFQLLLAPQLYRQQTQYFIA